jgi:hypothetical protein
VDDGVSLPHHRSPKKDREAPCKRFVLPSNLAGLLLKRPQPTSPVERNGQGRRGKGRQVPILWRPIWVPNSAKEGLALSKRANFCLRIAGMQKDARRSERPACGGPARHHQHRLRLRGSAGPNQSAELPARNRLAIKKTQRLR